MNYAKFKSKAKEKITQYGGDLVVIRKGSNKVYNPATNTYESDDVEFNGKAVLSNFDHSAVNGTTVLAEDVRLMCVLDSEPKITDKVKFGGKQYTIVNINACNPDGNLVIYYDLQVR